MLNTLNVLKSHIFSP